MEWVKDYWKRIEGAPLNVLVAIFLAFLLVKPMFQLSPISGFLYVSTIIWLIVFKVEILVKAPGYAVLLFIILAVRWGISPLLKDSISSTWKGNVLTAGVYILVWFIIYTKTKRLEEKG